MKKIIVLLLIFIICNPITYAVDNDIIEKIFEFTTYENNFNYDPPKNIEKDGIKYNLIENSIEYEIKNKNESPYSTIIRTLEKSNIIDKDSNDNFNKFHTFNIDNKDITLELSNIEYIPTDIIREALNLTQEITFPPYNKIPSPSNTMDFTYFDELSNQNIYTKLNLKSFSSIQDWQYSNHFKAEITVTNYTDQNYIINNSIIPNTSTDPNILGYENIYLKKLKLDPNLYIITSAKWDDDPYDINSSQKARKMIVNGHKYFAQFKASYKGTIDLPIIKGYNAIATYKTNIKNNFYEYNILAKVKYKKDNITTIGTINKVIDNSTFKNINISYIIIILSILLIILLLLIIYPIFFKKNTNIKIK